MLICIGTWEHLNQKGARIVIFSSALSILGQNRDLGRGLDLIAGADRLAADPEVTATTQGTTEAAVDHVTRTTKMIIPAKTETRVVADPSQPNRNTMTRIDGRTTITAAQRRKAQVVVAVAPQQNRDNH